MPTFPEFELPEWLKNIPKERLAFCLIIIALLVLIVIQYDTIKKEKGF